MEHAVMITYRIDVPRDVTLPDGVAESWHEIPRVFNHTAELLLNAERLLETYPTIRIRRING